MQFSTQSQKLTPLVREAPLFEICAAEIFSPASGVLYFKSSALKGSQIFWGCRAGCEVSFVCSVGGVVEEKQPEIFQAVLGWQ